MFDVYLEARSLDPRVRSRMMLSTIGAAAACMLAGAAMWSVSKMGIHRVSAPSVESVLFLQTEVTPPPPPSPPPAPKGSAHASSDDPPDDVDPRPAEPSPEDFVEPTPTRKSSDEVGSDRIGVPDGVPGLPSQAQCVAPPCGIGTTPGPVGISTVPTQKREPTTATHQPIRAMRAQAIYAPDPDPNQLRLTQTGRTSRRSGQSTVSFCVGTSGKVTDVRTAKRFSGDPQVDRICRKTVEKWRFRPFIVNGRARRTCSDVTFSIQFE